MRSRGWAVWAGVPRESPCFYARNCTALPCYKIDDLASTAMDGELPVMMTSDDDGGGGDNDGNDSRDL